MPPLSLSTLLTAATLTATIAMPLSTLGPQAARAQQAVPASAVRAINLARTTAIAQNGGLSRYRPAQCMFQTANPANPCLINAPDNNYNNNSNSNSNNYGNNNYGNNTNNNNNYVFRFQGGAPGWQQQNQGPTVETEITISPDGRNVVQVNYNGSPR